MFKVVLDKLEEVDGCQDGAGGGHGLQGPGRRTRAAGAAQLTGRTHLA